MYVYGVFIRKKQKSNINLDFDTQQLDIYLDDSGFFVFSSKDRYDFCCSNNNFSFLIYHSSHLHNISSRGG